MKNKGIAVLLLLVFCSCNKVIRRCTPEKFEYTFQMNKQIDTVKSTYTSPVYEYYNYQINNGSKAVFTYTHYFEDCPDIADDEGSRTIIFEVPSNTDYFKIEDSLSLRQAKVLSASDCFCQPAQPVFFKKGWIEGRKTDAVHWHISASLKEPWNNGGTISFDKTFTKN